MNIGKKLTSNFSFAGDTAIIAESAEELEIYTISIWK